MATNRDFVVKNGLVVTENIELGHATDTTIARASAGAITVEGTAVILAGDSPTFGTVTIGTDLIHDGDTNNKIAFGTDTQSFQTGGTARFNISDSGLQIGTGARVTTIEDNDSLGTSDTKLCTQGNVKAYVDANAGGGASAIGDLDDVLMDATNFVDSILIQPESDGSAPTTGTLNGASNNVGIGVDVFQTLTEGHSNVSLGYKASDSLTTGYENVHIGKEAGQANNVGAKNVYIGSGAGYSDLNGILGVAIGYRAQYTGGSNYSTAVGGECNYSSGSNFTGIGYRAGKSHSGSFNVAIGREALDASGSGGYNVAIGGRHALGAVSSGARNIGIGYQAADGFDTESDNIAIGYDALGGSVAGGEKNVVIGNYAGDGVTSADNTVMIGHEAGSEITTGSGNITIGYQAGDNITTGSNNLVIGAADVSSATGDSQLSISDGDGGTTWITGDSNGNVSLNQLADVVAVSSNTTLTQAQSGSYVYWTSGTLTLPADAAVGTQFTIFNNTGSSATVALGSGDAIISNWATNAAVADNDATAYVCVNISSSESQWVQVGA
tara:strand:- start:3259 stop:4920 length:1662 start_codon:yes stop_codon:yes gene_type:complete